MAAIAEDAPAGGFDFFGFLSPPLRRPLRAEMSEHRVEWHIEPEHVWGHLICEAPADGDCRMTCPEGCESWPCSHELIVSGDCNAVEWIENGDGLVDVYAGDDHALIDGPVDVRWTGDYYEWTYPTASTEGTNG